MNAGPHVPQIVLRGTYHRHPAKILIDCGATGDFISCKFVKTKKIPSSNSTPFPITLADGQTQEICNTRTESLGLHTGRYSHQISLGVITLNDDYDIILGMPWLQHANPEIDWINRQLTIQQRRGQIQLSAVDSPFHNVISALQFAKLTKTCEYYLGVIRTPETDTTNEPIDQNQP